MTAIPYAVAIIGMIVIPRYSDRTGERKRVVAACLALAAVAFVASTVVGPVAAIPALAVGLFFLLGVHGVFWTMPAALLSGAAAAAGIAMINSIGNLGGFVGPYLVGLVKDATGSTDGGLIVLAAILHRRQHHRPGRRARQGARAGAGDAHRPLRSHARSPSARRAERETSTRRGRSPGAVRLDYGVVVESVNVSVLAYVPVRSASPAATDCLKSIVTASLETGPA